MKWIVKILQVIAAVFVLSAFAWAQTSVPAQPSQQDHKAGMMAGHKAMMADMAAAEKKMDEMIAKMNAATGQAKVDQMAAVITELVAHCKEMHGKMMAQETAPAADTSEKGPEQHHE